MTAFFKEARKTLALASPMVLGQLATHAMQVTDMAMVGRVGVVPLAAASFGATVFGFFWLLGIGPVTALGIVVGEAHGASDDARARRVLRHGMVVVAAAGVLLTTLLVGVAGGTNWWHLGQPAEVIAATRSYLFYLAGSTVPLLLFISYKAYAEARGWPWLPLWFVLGSILLNIALNWVFIYGHLGAPAMGLDGAGLATLLSRLVVLAVFAWFLAVYRPIRLRWRLGEWLRNEVRLLWELCRLGFPISLQILFEVGAFNLALIMMGWLPDGTVALAAHSIALNYAALAFMVPLGVMFATSIRVSQARGAGRLEQARQIGWSAIGISALFMGGVAAFFVLGRQELPYLFLHDNVGDAAPAVLTLASTLLLFAAAFAVFDGVQVVTVGVLRGYRDVRGPTVLAFVVFWLVCLPMGFLLGFRLDGTDGVPPLVAWLVASLPLPQGGGMGAEGVWMGLVLGLVLISLALLGRFVVIARRAMAQVEAGGGGAA